MGLDAVIFCDCYERGRLKTPPPNPKLVYVFQNGDLRCRSDDPAIEDAFDRWRDRACKHECGMIAGGPLDNMASIELLNTALQPHRRHFPILLGKVIYCGTHTGDHLTLRNIEKLQAELPALRKLRTGDPFVDKELRILARQLSGLCRVSLKIRKPIAF